MRYVLLNWLMVLAVMDAFMVSSMSLTVFFWSMVAAIPAQMMAEGFFSRLEEYECDAIATLCGYGNGLCAGLFALFMNAEARKFALARWEIELVEKALPGLSLENLNQHFGEPKTAAASCEKILATRGDFWLEFKIELIRSISKHPADRRRVKNIRAVMESMPRNEA